MGLPLLLTLFSSICLATEASCSAPDSPVVKCGDGSPEIMYPFHVNGRRGSELLRSGFELSCGENSTMIHFPGYGDLVVKSISYDTKRVDLLDPKSCVHEVFLNLDLSLTPFHYYYFVKNYTYLNCSAKLPPSFDEVSCLSGSGHHVYTVETSLPVPDSCRPVKTVAIPFSFSPYINDNSFGLGLTWDMPGRGHDDSDRGFKTKWAAIVLGIGIFILAMAVLLRIKMQKPKKLDKLMGKESQLESQKLLAESV